MGMFNRLKQGLARSSGALNRLFTGEKLTPETLESFEDALIMADFGVPVTQTLTKALAGKRFEQAALDHEARLFLRQEIITMLTPFARPLPDPVKGQLTVLLLCGVNGGGKTTTTAKLAERYRKQGYTVAVVAADTFRAAAVEQLQAWAARLDVPCYSAVHGADAAALCYDSVTQAQRAGIDILLIDTAGRLHNQANLMAELTKVHRVIGKHDPALPQHSILILDGTVGQAGLSQVDLFAKAIPLSGLMITKLDGTARAGIVLAICQQSGLPLYAIGVGEQAEDLQDFDPTAFATALVG